MDDQRQEAPMTALKPDPIGRTALAVEITNRLRQMILEGVRLPFAEPGRLPKALTLPEYPVEPAALRFWREGECSRMLAAGLLEPGCMDDYIHPAFFIPKAFGTSLSLSGNANVALYGFILFYVLCLGITWFYYTRKKAEIPC